MSNLKPTNLALVLATGILIQGVNAQELSVASWTFEKFKREASVIPTTQGRYMWMMDGHLYNEKSLYDYYQKIVYHRSRLDSIVLEDKLHSVGEDSQLGLVLDWQEFNSKRDSLINDPSQGQRLTLTNYYTFSVEVLISSSLSINGQRRTKQITTQKIAPGAVGVVVIPFADTTRRELNNLDTSAQVQAIVDVYRNGEKIARESSPYLFLHGDPRGQIHLYDEAGLLSRHGGGDLAGSLKSTDLASEGFSGIGHGRLLSTKDLQSEGDPLDDLIQSFQQ